MSEKQERSETDWNTATYEVFTARQAYLRANNRSTMPRITAENYPEMVKRRGLLRSSGFEADEHSQGGVSVFVENEEDFKKLQLLVREKGYKLEMT